MGNRNPYRISIDQKTGFLYWGEVGPDASRDTVTRGPRGYDEVNQATNEHKEDIKVGSVLVREGEPVLVAVGAANHDALQFDSAGDLRFDRENTQHLGFGHGSHHCLGAPLARVELQEALRALITTLPNLTVAGDIAWKTAMLVRGPKTMPIGW
jgi:cytochrome P450